MKKALLLGAAALFASAPAEAISRYNSTSMSCQRVNATIQSQGAVIMRWSSTRNPGLPLYGRFVVDGRFCQQGEYAARAYIPASDTENCPVYDCEQIDLDGGPIIRFGR